MSFNIFFLIFLLVGCGVKGDPLNPTSGQYKTTLDQHKDTITHELEPDPPKKPQPHPGSGQ